MNNYLFETYDEFISRKVKEDQKHYDAGYGDGYNEGYESALAEIYEMIEEDASYSEVYESIADYLEEVRITHHRSPASQREMKGLIDARKKMRDAAGPKYGHFSKDINKTLRDNSKYTQWRDSHHRKLLLKGGNYNGAGRDLI